MEKLLQEHGGIENLCYYAAKTERLDILQWVHDNNFSFSSHLTFLII